MLDFRNFEVITFDCYGTLVDWESGILSVLRTFRDEHRIEAGDNELLECYARAETHVQRSYYRPYRDVLREVMKQIALRYRVSVDSYDEEALVKSLPDWKPFADTIGALAELRRHFRIAVISNIDDDLFAATREHLEVEFDWVITAEMAGAYKPAFRVFTAAREAIGVHPSHILHVAQSLFHDIRPAKTLGWHAVWVNRRGSRAGAGATTAVAAEPDLVVPGLAALAALACERRTELAPRDEQGHFYI